MENKIVMEDIMTTEKKARSVSAMDKAVELDLGHLAKHAYRNLELSAEEADKEAPPVPIRTFFIQAPILLDGIRYCNNLVGVETTNEVFFSRNHGAMQYVTQQDMNDYIDRDAEMVVMPAVIPCMANTRICVSLHEMLRVPGDEFKTRHANLLPGLDAELLEDIEAGRLDAYVVPHTYMRDLRERGWFVRSYNLHPLIEKMARYKLSEDEGSNTYQPYDGKTKMIFGMTGVKGDNMVKRVGIFFGQLPSKGTNDRGWIVFMYVATLQINYAALLLAHCDGTMERFFMRSGMVFPDIAFKKEDAAAKRRDRPNKTPRRRRRDEPAAHGADGEAGPDEKEEAKPDGGAEVEEDDEARPNVGSGFGSFEGTEVDDSDDEEPPAATGSN